MCIEKLVSDGDLRDLGLKKGDFLLLNEAVHSLQAKRSERPLSTVPGRTGMTLDDLLAGHSDGQHDRSMTRHADLDCPSTSR